MAFRTKLRGKHTLLYRRWLDMRGRTRGYGTKRPDLWRGKPVAWRTFAEFRAFALANGFSKATSSPDRIDESAGYVPGNVRFTTARSNSLRAIGHDDVRGEDPGLPECPF